MRRLIPHKALNPKIQIGRPLSATDEQQHLNIAALIATCFHCGSDFCWKPMKGTKSLAGASFAEQDHVAECLQADWHLDSSGAPIRRIGRLKVVGGLSVKA